MKFVAVVVTALLLMAANGFAQDPGEEAKPPAPPPARQLNLDPTAGASGRQGLVAHANVFEAYDTFSLVGDNDTLFGTPLNRSRLPSGAYSGLNGGLTYGYHQGNERASFGINGRSSVTYFPSRDSTFTSAGLAAIGAKQIGRHTTIEASPSISYASYYDLGLFPSLDTASELSGFGLTAPSLESSASTIPVIQYGFATGLHQQIAEHSTLALTYGLRRTNLRRQGTRLRDQTVGGQYSHGVSSHLGFHVGYVYRQADYANDTRPVRGHDIDVGVDYRRALSFSRRTTFSFGTGSSVIARDEIGAPAGSSRNDLRILANADLDHQMGQTWTARLSYRRDWQFVEGFAEPFFVDGVTLGIGGSMSRRLAVGAFASYLSGQLGLGALNGLQSYRGVAHLHMSLTRACAAYAQYLYYRSEFSDAVAAPIGYPRFFVRNGVRAGLTVALPLIR